MKTFYQKTAAQVAAEFTTGIDHGLTYADAKKRLETYGANAILEQKPPSFFLVFLHQFQNPLIYILLLAASIIFITGNHLDAFIISGVLLFNAIIGTIQEGRTHTLLSSMAQFIKVNAIVLRQSKHDIISDELLVPGDIIFLQEGSRIPADARIIAAHNLHVDQAMLTGESTPARKIFDVIPDACPLIDQKNMVFKGCYVVSGSGTAIVVATGNATEVGRLQKVVAAIDTDTPLKRELDRLSGWILLFILGVCLFLFFIGIYAGRSLDELLTMLTALFICVVPEGLPVVLTLVLVTGAYRMAQQKVLVKRLQGVDALGRAQVIVTDKTGTLTRNEMIVSQVYADNTLYEISGVGYFDQGKITPEGLVPAIQEIGIANALLNHAEIKYQPKLGTFLVEGEPTEAALFILSKKIGITSHTIAPYTLLYEIPFDATYAYHAGFYTKESETYAFITGSPEALFARCTHIPTQARETLKLFLDKGLRVVVVGTKRVPTYQPTDDMAYHQQILEKDITFLGICGMQDAIRPEVAPFIEQARRLGIQVVMATGDHEKTALFIAQKVGIYQENDEHIDGTLFTGMSDQELLSHITRITVYSRLTPENKVRLVSLFHQQNKVVVMTGDGVNDAPSLVAADVGIAMGGIGTQIAKEAADVVLLDDAFSNILHAIEQGKHIFYTLRRVILYFFATNLGEVFVVLFALALNMPLPILAAQILWLNLVTDGFLDIALSMEPQERDILSSNNITVTSHLIDRYLFGKTVYMALGMGIGSIAVFAHFYTIDLAKARTMTLITMAMYQWFNAWNCRSEIKSTFTLGFFANKWLLLATTVVGLLQYLVVRVPLLQHIFHTVPLSFSELGLILLITCPLFFIEEGRKWIMRSWQG